MGRRADRRDVAVLGLMLLGWGAVGAPLVHTLEHAAGHAHHHGAPQSPGPHGAGSVEHFLATFQVEDVDEVAISSARWVSAEPVGPAPVALTVRHSPPMPQGP